MIEILPHTADVAYKACGKNLKELFEEAVRGFFRSLVPPPYEPKTVETKEVSIKDEDLDLLLHSFLERLVEEFDVNGIVAYEADVNLKPPVLKARINFDSYERVKDYLLALPKAITWNDFGIRREGEYFCCKIVIDV